jgi:hypothetical protein
MKPLHARCQATCRRSLATSILRCKRSSPVNSAFLEHNSPPLHALSRHIPAEPIRFRHNQYRTSEKQAANMPAPKYPRKRDFYVYRFKVDSYPFYVGIGRGRRGSDRLRYVKSLLKPSNKANLARSALHVRVIAKFVRTDIDVGYSQTRRPLARSQALALEKKVIASLIRRGHLLTNWHHNPHRHNSVAKAVSAILKPRPAR